MAHVIFPHSLAGQVGDIRELEIPASNVRELLRELERRYPGIERSIIDEMSIAIDGEIFSDPFLEPIAPESEVHFLARLRGG